MLLLFTMLCTSAYHEIAKATNNYAKKLGGGGFGEVYKGVLNGTTVAVKRLTEVIFIHDRVDCY
jgi:hypothetical protein